MNILAIRFARLGDVVLLLPALSSLKRALPESRLTFLTGHRCAPIANLCPAIDELLAVNRVAMRDGPASVAFRDMVGLVRDVRRRRFDLVIDFHSFRETNLLTWLSGARVRIAVKRYKAPYLGFCFNRPPVLEDKAMHVAEMFKKVVEGVIATVPFPSGRGREARAREGEASGREARARQGEASRREARARQGEASRNAEGHKSSQTLKPSPCPLPEGEGDLVIPDELTRWADQISPNKLRITLFIDAPVRERIWPPERFADLADFAIEHLGALPIVISSNQGQELAKRVQRASRNSDQIALFTDISIPQMAALIASAHLFVSNDTGPMHIGPAVAVQTLGLFSVGYPEHFRPIGPNDRFLRANPIEKLETKEVIAVVNEMWATADPSLRC